jgi:hypothetical protein
MQSACAVLSSVSRLAVQLLTIKCVFRFSLQLLRQTFLILRINERDILLPGAELPLVESFGLLNDLFPFSSILDAGYPVLDLQLANVLFNVIVPSILERALSIQKITATSQARF